MFSLLQTPMSVSSSDQISTRTQVVPRPNTSIKAMAVAWRRHHQASLETQLWRTLAVEGREWLVKGLFQEDSYEILVCDLCAVWEESLEKGRITERCESLNPSVEAPLSVILANLSSHLDTQQPSASYSIQERDNKLTLSLSMTLSGLPFHWEFKCHKGDPSKLSSHLVSPLLSMVAELTRRQRELVRIIEKKDKEIQDYKDNGATVSRKYLQTVLFDEQAFTNEMTLSPDFQQTARVSLAALSDSTSQDLYRNVAMVTTWAQKGEVLPPSDATETATTGTWAGKLPASLLPSLPTAPLHTSPKRSPAKRPAEESPSKDDERTRRVALERKLEDDKIKGKKKKKKLM